jgi:uncharacterized membrane protein YgaE (UPF0421/DUF939 family)
MNRRLPAELWPLFQGALAATLAWVLAKSVFGHPQPFFAPVAAVIALNTVLGERGIQAVRLLYGVLVGIVVGELGLLVLGEGSGTLGLATLLAMVIAHALGGARITIAQAAVGAILTVAVASPEAGVERLADALIGTGVALVFSQVLFTPEPVGLLRRAEVRALRGFAEALALTGRALAEQDDRLSDEALERLRDLRDRLAEVSRMRRAGSRVVQRTLAWRGRREPLVQESENAAYLDLLGASCLVLTRAAAAVPAAERAPLVPVVPRLADAVAEMAADPGDRERRQRAADGALDVIRRLAPVDAAANTPLAAALVATRAVAVDVMSFAGLDPAQAAAVVEQETGELEVPAPPSVPRPRLRRRG